MYKKTLGAALAIAAFIAAFIATVTLVSLVSSVCDDKSGTNIEKVK